MDWIPAKLRLIRQEFNMTQLELAQASGLSQRDVSQLENGRKEGLPKEFIQFLHGRGVDLNWLFSDPEHEAAPNPSISGSVKKYATQGDFSPLAVVQEDNSTGYNRAKSVGPPVTAAAAIALVDAVAQQSYPARYADPAFRQSLPIFTLPLPQVQQGLFRGFEVTTADLLPTLAIRDWVIARSESPKSIESGELYVVVTNESVQVRRVFLVGARAKELLLKADRAGSADTPLPVASLKELWRVQGRLSFQLPVADAAPEPKVAVLEASLKDLLNRVQRLEQGR